MSKSRYSLERLAKLLNKSVKHMHGGHLPHGGGYASGGSRRSKNIASKSALARSIQGRMNSVRARQG
jgi:hypothetical protein